jgi:hypothetical protein
VEANNPTAGSTVRYGAPHHPPPTRRARVLLYVAALSHFVTMCLSLAAGGGWVQRQSSQCPKWHWGCLRRTRPSRWTGWPCIWNTRAVPPPSPPVSSCALPPSRARVSTIHLYTPSGRVDTATEEIARQHGCWPAQRHVRIAHAIQLRVWRIGWTNGLLSLRPGRCTLECSRGGACFPI